MNRFSTNFSQLIAGFFSLTLSIFQGVAGAQSDLYELDLRRNPGSVLNCRATLEFDGNVLLFSTEPEQDNSAVPMSVKSKHSFDQIQIDDWNVLRKYSEALAEITLNKKQTTSELSTSNRQIVVRLTKSGFQRPLQYFSNGGALTQGEQELLQVPCDPVALTNLLRHPPVGIGKPWTPDQRDAQAFFSLDNVIENRLALQLKEVDQARRAKIYLTGEITGEVDGGTTKIRISAVALVDLDGKVPTAFRANLTEYRESSQIAPGFEGNVKVDLAFSSKSEREVSAESVKQVSTKIREKQNSRLLWNSDSEFEMVYDPKWKIILSDSDVVVMRYADKGNLLAQCNVMGLPRRPANNQLALSDFESQLAKNIIGSSAAKITSSNSMTTSTGLKVLQVIVAGVQDSVPINWIYYHLSHADGRCVAVVLTIEDAALESFANADLKLLESIRFIDAERKADGANLNLR